MNRVTAVLRRPSLWAATAVSMALIVLMVGLKFIAYHDLVVPLSYVLALLVVLWHRNRWLLWIMAGCFAFSAAHAVVWIAPGEHYSEDLQQIVFLGMHWINIVVAAGVLHAVVNYRERLERSNSELTAELPTMKIIGMSMHEDDETSSAMRKAGAVSYLTKGGMAEELLGAIRGAVAPAARPLADATRPVSPDGSLDPARHRGS